VPNINDIAFWVIREISGCKYVYATTIRDAVRLWEHHNAGLSDEDRQAAEGVVKSALLKLGFYAQEGDNT
jgi:hypothetical protein